MPRLTKIYTRTGDEGETSLGIKRRVSKDDVRVVAYGDVDELNSAIGVVLAQAPAAVLVGPLESVQNDLFHLGSELCIPPDERGELQIPITETRHIERLEKWLDELLLELPALDNFILPGGTAAAACLQLARTICRRAERSVVTLARSEEIGGEGLAYLNRLSDLLFVMARRENQLAGHDETLWDSRR